MVDPKGALAACQAVWERCRLGTPGFTTRPDPEIAWTLKDLEGFCVFAGDDGYALYTVDRQWPGPNAEFKVKVQELMAATPAAYAALWQYLCGLTHVVEVVANVRPIDEPVQHLVRQPRRVDVSHVGDGLWLKPLDRAALCAARGLPDPGPRRRRRGAREPPAGRLHARLAGPCGPHPPGRRAGVGLRDGPLVAARVLGSRAVETAVGGRADVSRNTRGPHGSAKTPRETVPGSTFRCQAPKRARFARPRKSTRTPRTGYAESRHFPTFKS